MPIREGLEVASRLGEQPMGEPLPAGEGQPMGEGQPAGEGQPMGEGQPGQGQPMGEGQPGQGQPGQGQPMGQGQPGEGQLGTGFVPASPEVTAQQIAGAQANAAASQALAAAAAAGQPIPGQPAPGQGQSQTPMEGQASQTASKGGAAKSGDTSNNQKPPPGELSLDPAAQGDSRGEKVDQDAAAADLKFAGEPWFAKLPPGLKQAIQAKARGKAPRGYEERLRRYFESVD
jgi:hypothetical protein